MGEKPFQVEMKVHECCGLQCGTLHVASVWSAKLKLCSLKLQRVSRLFMGIEQEREQGWQKYEHVHSLWVFQLHPAVCQRAKLVCWTVGEER